MVAPELMVISLGAYEPERWAYDCDYAVVIYPLYRRGLCLRIGMFWDELTVN